MIIALKTAVNIGTIPGPLTGFVPFDRLEVRVLKFPVLVGGDTIRNVALVICTRIERR